MYQNEIAPLKQNILEVQPFEACTILNPEFSGIKILGVKKVPVARGLNCVFIDLENYRGNDYFVLLNGSLRYSFSKPVNEVGCHVDIYGNDNSIRIFGSNPKEYSQLIGDLTFNHTNAGHSSYYIYAVKTSSQVLPPKPDNKALWLIGEIQQRLKELKEIVE